jgi:hypothetical protein
LAAALDAGGFPVAMATGTAAIIAIAAIEDFITISFDVAGCPKHGRASPDAFASIARRWATPFSRATR